MKRSKWVNRVSNEKILNLTKENKKMEETG